MSLFLDQNLDKDGLILQDLGPAAQLELAKRNSSLFAAFCFQDKDGSPIPAVVSSRIICNEGGNPVSIVGSISDTTHRQMLRADRQRAVAAGPKPNADNP